MEFKHLTDNAFVKNIFKNAVVVQGTMAVYFEIYYVIMHL